MRPLLIIVLLFTFGNIALAQSFKGFVIDKTTRESIPYANVKLVGTNKGAITSDNGYFSLGIMQTGSYELVITSIGYDTLRETIIIKAEEAQNRKFFMTPVVAEQKTVTIRSRTDRVLRQTTANISNYRVNPQQVSKLPSIGGSSDLVQYLSVLPGVINNGDQGGQVYFRGGTSAQNLNLLDGIVIYNPYHSVGLYSVFETDILKSVDVYTAGFNADYGSRASGVLDVKTKDGAKGKTNLNLNAGPFVASATVDGPLYFNKDKDNSLTYLLSVRGSYLDQVAPKLYPYAEQNGTNLPYKMLDVIGKVTLAGTGGSKIGLTGFNFTDEAALSNDAIFRWYNTGFGGNFSLVPNSSNVVITGTLASSTYQITVDEETSLPRKASINGFNGGLNFSYFNNNNELKYGIGAIGNSANFTARSPNLILTDLEANNTEIFGYIKYRAVNTRWVVEPGFRLQYYASLNVFSPEPRLAIKYNVDENIRIKGAAGLYSQNLFSTTSDRDVVSLFNGYAISPDNARDGDGNKISNPIQLARHFVFGGEWDVNDRLQLNAEAYLKEYNQVINYNREKTSISDPDYIAEEGLAYGIDLFARYSLDDSYFQVGYSIARVNRTFGDNTYAPAFDRRHNLNMLAGHSFGRNKSWDFNIRWALGSGFPFTQTVAFYEQLNFGGGVDGNPINSNGQLGIYYGTEADYNKGRLPYYHRLDASLKKNFKLGKQSKLGISAGVTNAYNRANLFYIDRVSQRRFDQLPILPTLSMNISL
jgi:hypothetical protein